MRPLHGIKAMALAQQISGVLEEQPMPTVWRRGALDIQFEQAWMMAKEIESWPQPAHKVEIEPS